jgi:hypothetical protein
MKRIEGSKSKTRDPLDRLPWLDECSVLERREPVLEQVSFRLRTNNGTQTGR